MSHLKPQDAVIVEALRTPRGRGKPLGSSRPGALAGIHPQELAAQILDATVSRTGIPARDVDDVILGCVTQAGEQGANIARHAVLTAGWPVSVPATTLTRACGSGLEAIHMAVNGVLAGAHQVVLAGGVESMSRVPMGSDTARLVDPSAPGADAADRSGVGDGGNPQLRRRIRQVPQGISADLIATLEGFSREEIDAFALRSQQQAAIAIREGRFARSLVPVRDPASGQVVLDHEEYPRETTAEALASLGAAFATLGAKSVSATADLSLDQLALTQVRDRLLAGLSDEGARMQAAVQTVQAITHVHTAGNSSGIADGGAAVLVASHDYARAHGLRARARIRAMATVGSDPVLMLTAPTPASQLALSRAGLSVSDVDLWEINEAFATVPLRTIRDLGIHPDRVNVNGGAIALGHPLGASGAMLLGTVLDELERRGQAIGVVTLCIAGGLGIAAVVERV
ncbi:MAG TPA: acetyl-CoA C-acyltransferase [Gemmatimonas aurantiaca]|uniref:Acetyl-CoA acyltransferase n=2 Tax=Gemmatimonas aurantiaca TaxID=173480 RepID=C1ACQ9_GEMAT|nr:acetyl-CoA C-acyltransferase [Gemmatimonas aurantiaca]BAH40286.1 acetyl-CoA acyltransferase [Gemmatimonas aurantiaca T-27]HCT57703.1 acetyl-CoA C-acyltransferase [Gemmatimonas aurantiaca]